MITEVPAAFSKVILGLESPEKLKAQGMTVINSEERSMGSAPGRMIRVRQEAQGTMAEKWLWAFGTEDRTVMILGTAFQEEELAPVLGAIVTASWDPNHTVDQAEGVGFAIEPGKLVLWTRMGDMLMYTSDGKPDLNKTGKPMFFGGPSISATAVEDMEAFAKKRASELPLSGVQIQSTESITIADLPGVALHAEALESGGEGTRFIYQVIPF